MASTSKRKRGVPSCPVCCETFTLRDRKPVQCASCDFEACARCHEKYLESVETPRCMQCGQAWSRDFVDSQFKKAWLQGAYMEHRQTVLLEQEMAQLPASQYMVRNFRTAQSLQQDIVRGQERKVALWKEIDRINQDRWNMEHRIERIVQSGYHEDGSAAAQDQPPYRFVRACPAEGCKGFLDAAKYMCGICGAEACERCFAIKDDAGAEHACKAEDVQTATLLKKDTKPCPSCASMIHKTDGCFAADTPILCYDGTIKMSQDVVAGDTLVGDDGGARTVQEVRAGEDQLYRVTQSAGCTYTVNSKHTLVLKRDEATEELLVAEFVDLPASAQRQFTGYTSTGRHSHISVRPVGRGTYHGWLLDGNHRFVLPDMTVVRNCDQMWCTQCHTAFSWRTGLKVRAGVRIHNPEYFRYLRSQSATAGEIRREPGLTDCQNANNQLPPHVSWAAFIRQKGANKSQADSLYSVYHTLWYLQYNVLNRNTLRVPVVDNSDLRLQYLLGNLTPDQWKAELARRETRVEMIDTFRAIYQTALDAGKDRLLDYYDAAGDENIETFLREVAEIFVDSNIHLTNAHRRFNQSRTIYMLPIPFYLPNSNPC